MRIIRPPRRLQRQIVAELHDAYAEPTHHAVQNALRPLATHYGVSLPRIRWMDAPERRYALGLTHDSGVIALIHPDVWRRQKTHNTELEWIAVVLHEAFHWLFFVQQERKADAFAAAFLEES